MSPIQVTNTVVEVPVGIANSLINGFPLSARELNWSILDFGRATLSPEPMTLCVPLRGEYEGTTVDLTPRDKRSIPMQSRGLWFWFPVRPGWAWLSPRRAWVVGQSAGITREGYSSRFRCRVGDAWLRTETGQRKRLEALQAMRAVEAVLARRTVA